MAEQPKGRGRPLDVALLSVEQMYLADRLTMEGGLAGKTLMSNAGAAVVERAGLPATSRDPEAQKKYKGPST